MRLRKAPSGAVSCGALGEDLLLEKILPSVRRSTSSAVVGPGDDCAVVRARNVREDLLLKTDCVVEGIHFRSNAAPHLIGWKAMVRPLSDIAAMSGLPQFALVTLILPRSKTLEYVRGIYRGLKKAARMFEVTIVGGETSATRGPVVISVSVMGLVERKRWVGRAGGKAGDEVFVTGRLGGSIRAKHLRFVPRIEESRWLTKNYSIHAMVDLSDGLGADLPRLALASKVGFVLDPSAIPRNRGCTLHQALTDGEDHELLFAVSSSDVSSLLKNWRKRFPDLPLTRIGRLHSSSESRRSKLPRGYVHFK